MQPPHNHSIEQPIDLVLTADLVPDRLKHQKIAAKMLLIYQGLLYFVLLALPFICVKYEDYGKGIMAVTGVAWLAGFFISFLFCLIFPTGKLFFKTLYLSLAYIPSSIFYWCLLLISL